jgi:hypothetical protein
MPGLYVNLSKSGASLSVGGHGITENISRRGVRTTLSIPGTGLSYTTRTAKWRRPQPLAEEERRENAAAFTAIAKTIAVLVLLFVLFVIVMATANAKTQDPLASALARLRGEVQPQPQAETPACAANVATPNGSVYPSAAKPSLRYHRFPINQSGLQLTMAFS